MLGKGVLSPMYIPHPLKPQLCLWFVRGSCVCVLRLVSWICLFPPFLSTTLLSLISGPCEREVICHKGFTTWQYAVLFSLSSFQHSSFPLIYSILSLPHCRNLDLKPFPSLASTVSLLLPHTLSQLFLSHPLPILSLSLYLTPFPNSSSIPLLTSHRLPTVPTSSVFMSPTASVSCFFFSVHQ